MYVHGVSNMQNQCRGKIKLRRFSYNVGKMYAIAGEILSIYIGIFWGAIFVQEVKLGKK